VTGREVVVVGLGAAGSSVLYQLARRGVSVLGVDRFQPPHDLGSTHGDTRITREAIGEGGEYVPLVRRSMELWREIENASGLQLFTRTGALILGRPGELGAMHGKSDFVGRTIRAARDFGVTHELVSADDVRERFPSFRTVGDEIAYHEPGAGFLRPERCVSAQLQLARSHGAEVRTDERVLSCRPRGAGVVVETAGAEYVADRAVVCAGPWVAGLVSADLARLFTVHRQVMHWFDVAEVYSRYAPDAFPVFVWERGRDGVIYGVPAVDGPTGGFKVAFEQYDVATDPDAVVREVALGETSSMYERYVAPCFAGAGPACIRATSCSYTCTPDFDFVIDDHPESDRMLLVSACSGHGFKHSAAIGEAAAQRVVDGRSALDLSAFALSRFAALSAADQRAPIIPRSRRSGRYRLDSRRNGGGNHEPGDAPVH